MHQLPFNDELRYTLHGGGNIAKKPLVPFPQSSFRDCGSVLINAFGYIPLALRRLRDRRTFRPSLGDCQDCGLLKLRDRPALKLLQLFDR